MTPLNVLSVQHSVWSQLVTPVIGRQYFITDSVTLLHVITKFSRGEGGTMTFLPECVFQPGSKR